MIKKKIETENNIKIHTYTKNTMSTNAEYEIATDVKFDPNAHINRVNAAYLAKKNGNSSKNSQFYSAPIGAHILNAVDGTRYNHKVGSYDEKRYWTVMVNDGKQAAKLFYNSPEQYEQHRGTVIAQEEKDTWRAKQETIRREEIGLETN